MANENGFSHHIVNDSDSPAEARLWRALDSLSNQISALEARMLSEDDVDALHVVLEQDRRTRWLWATARAWALWITAVVAGFTVGVDALKALMKRLMT